MTQRNGKNAPIQGTSADILKRALRLLNDELRQTSAKIVNIIHDEIVVEVDEDEAPAVAQTVERAMCAAGVPPADENSPVAYSCGPPPSSNTSSAIGSDTSPLPSTVNDVPSQRVMRLVLTPPACVNGPPR